MSGRLVSTLLDATVAALAIAIPASSLAAKTFYSEGTLVAPVDKVHFQATYQDFLGNWYALVQHTTNGQKIWLEGAAANELIAPQWHMYVGSEGADADADIDSAIVRCNQSGKWLPGHMAHNTGVLSGVIGVMAGKRIARAHNYAFIDNGPSIDVDCGMAEYVVEHN